MKKVLAFILTAVFTFAGLWLALLADASDNAPVDQGALSFLAALTFCAALLCAGWGSSMKKEGRRYV